MTGMPIKHPIPDKLVRMPKNMRTNPVALRAGFQLMAMIMAIIMATVIDSINKAESGQCLVTLRCFLSIQPNDSSCLNDVVDLKKSYSFSPVPSMP